jgi:predicted small lipoprotein YifL
MRSTIRTLAAAAAIVAIAACSESSGPVSVPGQGDVDDEGTYTATGTATSGTWTQQSTLDANLQYSGTYSWNAATSELTLDTSVQGVRNVLVLEKQ